MVTEFSNSVLFQSHSSEIQRRSDATVTASAMDGKMYIAGGYTNKVILQTVEMQIAKMDFRTEIAHMNSPVSGKHFFKICLFTSNKISFFETNFFGFYESF